MKTFIKQNFKLMVRGLNISMNSLFILGLIYICTFFFFHRVKAQALPYKSENFKSTSPTCRSTIERVGIVQVSSDFDEKTNRCWLGIHNINSYKTLLYRDFLFTEEGLFFVFNSYGEGPPSQTTGVREYYKFPRKLYPRYLIDQKRQTLKIKLSNGESIYIDVNSMQIMSMVDSKFIEDEKVLPTNQGGFEMSPLSHILLDCGFKMGDSPSSNPNQICQFTDPKGKICQVQAKNIFNYDSDGDSSIKFKNDFDLAIFLMISCNDFDTSPLGFFL